MSTSPVYRWLDDRRFDVDAAAIGLLLAIALLPLRLFISQLFIVALPIMMGLGCVLYLLAVRYEDTRTWNWIPAWAARALPSATFFGLAALVVLSVHQGGRTPAFYNLASIVGIAIFLQIFFVREEDLSIPLLLGQVLAFAFVLRAMALYTAPSYTGVDIWSHVPTYAGSILAEGSIDPIADNKYFASPLFHLLVVTGSLILGTGLTGGLYLTLGLAMPLSILFVYATATYFVDTRWAVFATAVFGVSGNALQWGFDLIPTSLGLLFFVAILYVLTRILLIAFSSRDFSLVVLFSVGVILTHQISSFIVLILTGAGLLAYLVLRTAIFASRRSRSDTREAGNLTGLLVFDLGFITFMWSLTPHQGSTFLETMFNFFHSAVMEGGFLETHGAREAAAVEEAAEVADPTFIEQVVMYVDATGFLLLFLLTTVGCLYVLRRRNVTHAALMIVVSIVVMCVFVFGFPVFGIRTFVPSRWYAFMAAPMAIVGAIGLAYLARNANPALVLSLLLIFALVFPAVSVINSSAVMDSPRFDDAQTRYSYTSTELGAVDTIGEILVLEEGDPEEGIPAERLFTDQPYQTVFERTERHPSSPAVVPIGGNEALNETVVYRDYQQHGAPHFLSEFGVAHQPSVDRESFCAGERDHLYDNGDVVLCRNVDA